MAVSSSYRSYVLDQLQGAAGKAEAITAKSMFGGVGLYHGGAFFGLIDNDVLYLKVDDSNRGDYERVSMRPFRPYGDASYAMSYYEVPADVLEDRDALADWMAQAVEAARRSAKTRKKPRKRS